MASYQYVYHMNEVSKTYPGGKKVFENIRLNFLPGVKIGDGAIIAAYSVVAKKTFLLTLCMAEILQG